MKRSVLKAILTDSHFWVPVVVLAFGIALLVVIR
ncbi:MAG: translocated intimin receptor Tir [Terriglobia bacterium]